MPERSVYQDVKVSSSVNQTFKSVVREIRTLRFVGVGAA